MGKAGGRKKPRAGACSGMAPSASSSSSWSKVEADGAMYARQAQELKEEGNRRFQVKDYGGAMEQYEQALKLIPKGHPDRAVFHSNRAACLLQMKPPRYDAVISECTLALDSHPSFARALFRRARAYEATGKLPLALQDVQLLLLAEPSHLEALDMAKRLRAALGSSEEAQLISHDKSFPSPSLFSGTSPAALGASAVRGSPVGGLGPCLPARPLPKKKAKAPEPPPKAPLPSSGNSSPTSVLVPPSRSMDALLAKKQATENKESLQAEPAVPNGHLNLEKSFSGQKAPYYSVEGKKPLAEIVSQTRPLKLVYGHDIRLAQIPVNCRFSDLRELVRKKFPFSGSVLLKYKDLEGDLVTITCTAEVRLAESIAAIVAQQKSMQASDSHNASSKSCEPLRLHVVEVSMEQEPVVDEEELELASEANQNVDEVSNASTDSALMEAIPEQRSPQHVQESSQASKPIVPLSEKNAESHVCEKEIEIDEWLLDFAHLFRTHLGIDPDGHIDLHEVGMELCAEALEETVTSEEAQRLFELAACKFQEVAALAFFNWGNVHMCVARKCIAIEGKDKNLDSLVQLQAAFEAAQSQYSLAAQRYEEALRIKSDFYEGVLALGQERFESAKLHWSVAMASKVDLSSWDSSKTLELFSSAEEKMQTAVEMWEKLEAQRRKDAQTSISAKKDALKFDSRSHGNMLQPTSEAEAAEQVLIMRSQINLFWGNILFEHSQVEFKLGLQSWKDRLDVAVGKFQLAGASSADITQVLKNHVCNATAGIDSTSDGSQIAKLIFHQGYTCKHGNEIRNDARESQICPASENEAQGN